MKLLAAIANLFLRPRLVWINKKTDERFVLIYRKPKS